MPAKRREGPGLLAAHLANDPDEATVRRTFVLDRRTADEARERIGARGLSMFVNDAIARRLQYLRLMDWLEERREELGPISEAARERVEGKIFEASL